MLLGNVPTIGPLLIFSRRFALGTLKNARVMHESVQANHTTLEGKEASAHQSVESTGAKPQASMATPTEKDTRPKVLIHRELRKVRDGYPTDACVQLENDPLSWG